MTRKDWRCLFFYHRPFSTKTTTFFTSFLLAGVWLWIDFDGVAESITRKNVKQKKKKNKGEKQIHRFLLPPHPTCPRLNKRHKEEREIEREREERKKREETRTHVRLGRAGCWGSNEMCWRWIVPRLQVGSQNDGRTQDERHSDNSDGYQPSDAHRRTGRLLVRLSITSNIE